MSSEAVICIDTAALMMGVSKRTLWRHLSDGKLSPLPKSPQGKVMVRVDEVAARLLVPLEADEYRLLTAADGGNVDAQADLALLLLEHHQPEVALVWLQQAAQRGHADACHLLSSLYEKGSGTQPCADTALIWRSKAAALGHAIAREQLATLQGHA